MNRWLLARNGRSLAAKVSRRNLDAKPSSGFESEEPMETVVPNLCTNFGQYSLIEICPKYVYKFRTMADLKKLILSRIKNDTQIGVWTAADFLDLSNRDAVDKTLQRLAAQNEIRRIDRGLYDKPQINELTKKESPADPRHVIEAIVRRDQIRILVDGMTAANDLGLTNAVPAKIIVHTDARLRQIKLGNRTITFRLTAPSKLYWAGRPAMRLVQAMHWLRDAVDAPTLNAQIRSFLKRAKNAEALKADLADGMSTLPAWMQDLLKPIVASTAADQ